MAKNKEPEIVYLERNHSTSEVIFYLSGMVATGMLLAWIVMNICTFVSTNERMKQLINTGTCTISSIDYAGNHIVETCSSVLSTTYPK